MDFGFSPEQDMLRQTARAFLAENCPTSLVRQLWRTSVGISQNSGKTWPSLAGWASPFRKSMAGRG